MELEKLTSIANDVLGHTGRMIGGSKSGYRRRYPTHLVAFNANLCTRSGKFWYGDVDVTLDDGKLQEIANHAGEDVYVLYEFDARFGNEDSPDFSSPVAVYSPKSSGIKPLVYVASPYTHIDPAEVERRYREISRVCAKLVASGVMAISPVTYGHTLLEHYTMPGDWDFWMNFCISLLSKCDKLMVVKMPGWETSRGVTAEIKFAQENGIEVEFIEYPQ